MRIFWLKDRLLIKTKVIPQHILSAENYKQISISGTSRVEERPVREKGIMTLWSICPVIVLGLQLLGDFLYSFSFFLMISLNFSLKSLPRF